MDSFEKKYKEALNKAKDMLSYKEVRREDMEYLFPELKESEDEKIRKELIGFLRNIPNSNYTCEEMALWLEKQGTQPRYNIGDIICDKSCTTLNKEAQPNMEIVDIKNGIYICDKGSFPVSQQDEYELVSKKIDTKLNDDSVSNELREASTKHAEMELKNQTFPDNKEFELIYTFEEGAKWEAAQKSAWSEKHIADVFEKVGLAKIVREQSNDALIIALQDAMIELSKVTLQPKPTAWSEEDNVMIRCITLDLELLKNRDDGKAGKAAYQSEIEWLKSLKNRVGCEANCITTKEWKPSDEQMEVLLSEVTGWKKGCSKQIVLESLYNDLKKLK